MTACLVVPCFNEASRLDVVALEALIGDERVSLVLVDDGSTDSTPGLLRSFESRHPRVEVLTLEHNSGKGEAVRRGLQSAARTCPGWIGYVDADLATPPREMLRLLDVAIAGDRLEVVLGSRVAVLGRDIHRSAFRHYTGRMFATLASWVLDKPVYDTQCGAKWFRSTPSLAGCIAKPFHSRWAFDVELLGRLAAEGVPADAFWEEPLLVWHDVDDSRRSLRSSLRACADMAVIWQALRRYRS